ncbi:MAG TPA: SNF2 helicase associated domain-containing protein [Bacillota bacterium]|nr:SNF2 helicase associated domain-containing protein [Bacillota bacterium]
MHKITEASIKRFFRREIYNRGLKYFQGGRVVDLSFDLNHHIWTAQVVGTNVYYVEIDLEHIEEGTIQAHCDCPAFATYGPCKHNVAVLLAIAKRQKMSHTFNSQYTIDSPEQQLELTKMFTEIVRQTTQTDEEIDVLSHKQPMHVQYELKWSETRNFFIELKTGIDYYYVVKDIPALLKAVFTKDVYVFTQKFKYNPNEHYFLEQDLQIFRKLQQMINNEKLYRSQWLAGSYGTNAQQRYQTIAPLIFPELIEQFAKRDLTVELDEQIFHHVEISYDKLPYTFELTKDDSNEFILKLPNDNFSFYDELYNVVFIEGTFYFLNEQQQSFLERVSEVHIPSSQLQIPEKEASSILSDLIPALEKVANVHVDEQVSDQMIEAPLKTKIYLDITEQMIIGTLEYHYEEYIINPFTNEGAAHSLIIRDRETEEQMMQRIEQANFFYNGSQIYIDINDETLYEFLYEALPMLEQHMDVYLTTTLQRLIIDEPARLKTNVRVNESTQLLEVNFDITGIDEAEIVEVLQSVVEKKRFHRLNSGALLRLSEADNEKLDQFITNLNVPATELASGQVELPLYRSSQMEEVIDAQDYDATFEKLLHNLAQPEEVTYDVPPNLQATLRPYQRSGYQWFKTLSHYHLGGILADDMGLGKTLQTITYLLSVKSDRPHLVIAPSSVVYNWKSEINRFAPSLEVAMITGTQDERQQKIEQSLQADIWLTSYAMARQDINLYEKVTFQTLILDEAQYIKNYETKTSQAIRKIKATHRFALSGTPIENNIEELWAIFQVIMPGFMPSRKRYRQLEYETIARMVRPFILRRLKNEVLEELPEKIESALRSELTIEQKELYLGYLQRLQKETIASLEHESFHKQRMKILAGLTRLRQICCHPGMFIDNYEGKSGKLEQLIELVKTSLESGHRMLIFSQFTSMHEIIMKRLQRENIEYFYLHGGTPSEERLHMSERFNNGEKDVFLISLRAGGTGLNLTGADTVVLYDLWWNPAVEDQAADRAHRFGQKNVVQVIRLICEGTIEEKIYELQQQKRELIDQVIQPGDTPLAQLTEEDIKRLLNI